MRHRIFAVRMVNLLLIVAVLLGYQAVKIYRGQEEEIAYLESRLAAARTLQETAEDEEQLSSYRDGTYTGAAEGFGGTIEVEVTVSAGQIEDIQVISAKNEDGAYLDMALDVIDEIIEQQSADVDAVSGATFSSNGIINAVKAALEEGSVQ